MLALLAPRIALNQRQAQLFLVLMLGIGALITLAQWPSLGIYLTIVAALMVPIAISTGTETGVNAAVLLLIVLLGLWILGMIARPGGIRFHQNRAVYASLVLCLVALIAFGFGQFAWFPIQSAPIGAQVGGLMIFLLTAGAFLLVAHQVQNLNQLKAMTWVFLAVSALYVAVRLLGYPESRIYQIFVRNATQSSMFFIFLISIGTSQALLNTELSKGWRAAIGALVAGTLFLNLIVGRYWLSGLLPALVGVVFILLLYRPRWALVLMILGGIYLLVGTNFLGDIISGGDNAFSQMTRLEAWRILAEMVSVNPIFGLGMANYYWYTPLYSILGWNVRFNSHNNYVDIVAQAGLVGLGVYLWLLWEILLTGLRLLKGIQPGFSKAYIYGALGGLVGAAFAGMLGDWVVPFVYNIGLEGFRASMIGWMFLGGIIAIERMQSKDIKSGPR